MRCRRGAIWLVLAGCGACAAPSQESSQHLDGLPPAAAAGTPGAHEPQGFALEAGAVEPVETSAPPGAVALSVWNDPSFQRRFAESYLAETEIEPRTTELEREALQRAMDLLAAERTDEALGALSAVAPDERGATLDYMLANVHTQREELEQAAAAYETATLKFPKFRRAWRNLGQLYVRRGQFDRAAQALVRAIELGGGDGVTYGLLGVAHSNQEQHLAAESAYRMALLLDPSTLDWRLGLASSFFKQSRFADAAALCGELIAAQPERAELWLLQAKALVGLGQPLRAAENYEIVASLGQASAEHLNTLGDIYVNAEHYGLAVDAYLKALELPEATDLARPLRGAKVLAARGALDEARGLIERIEAAGVGALEDGARVDLLKLRARMAVAAGADEEEARALEAIVELDPLDGEALLLLGQHRNRAGDAEQAIFYYERAASLEAFEADAKVRHAQVLVGQGRYQEALPLLRRAQALKPRDNIQEYLQQVERVAQGR